MWNSENIWKRHAALPEAGIASQGRAVAAGEKTVWHCNSVRTAPAEAHTAGWPAMGAVLRLCALLLCAVLLAPGNLATAHAQEAQQVPAAGTAAGTAEGRGNSRGPSVQEQQEALPPERTEGPVEVTELWAGSLYSSTYKVGLCFSADGKVRGVVHLRLYNGKVDVYHIEGSVQNNEIQARHSSGHTFKGRLVSASKVEGVIKVKNGMSVRLEGSRTHDVPLAPENCAPLPQ